MATTTKPQMASLGLSKQKLTALAVKAKHLGLSPARYVRQLVEDDLAIESDAQSMSLAEIMAPVRKEFLESGMTEDELDNLVNRVRSRRRRRTSGRK